LIIEENMILTRFVHQDNLHKSIQPLWVSRPQTIAWSKKL